VLPCPLSVSLAATCGDEDEPMTKSVMRQAIK